MLTSTTIPASPEDVVVHWSVTEHSVCQQKGTVSDHDVLQPEAPGKKVSSRCVVYGFASFGGSSRKRMNLLFLFYSAFTFSIARAYFSLRFGLRAEKRMITAITRETGQKRKRAAFDADCTTRRPHCFRTHICVTEATDEGLQLGRMTSGVFTIRGCGKTNATQRGNSKQRPILKCTQILWVMSIFRQRLLTLAALGCRFRTS